MWAIDGVFQDRAIAILASGRDLKIPEKKAAYIVNTAVTETSGKTNEMGSVAVIPVIGTMTRYGGLCALGSEQLAQWVHEVDNDESFIGAVLEVNGPGGTVDGTKLLADAVAKAKKPIVAYVTGRAASGQYYVASQASCIVIETEHTELGSIGVLSTHIDESQALEKAGIKVTYIRADGSEDKAKYNVIEPISEELIAEAKASMKPVRDAFETAVRAKRPKVKDDLFSGKMYNGKDAIRLGLADKVGLIGDAVKEVIKLTKK
jgi:protease IV